jgi:hypothetical protein
MTYNEYNKENLFLEGYYDALLEIQNGNFDNPTKMRFFGTLGGGDISGDIASSLGISDKDDIKVKAMEYAMERGETFKEPFISGNGTYGHKNDLLYRKNGIFPGGRVTSTIEYNRYADIPTTRVVNGQVINTTAKVKTGTYTIPDSKRYLELYKHLKPRDRERVIKDYEKYCKTNKKKRR